MLKAEVVFNLGNFNQGKSFGIVISEHLDLYNQNQTNKIELINRLGCDLKGNYHLHILGTGEKTEISNFKTSVEDFINNLFENLKDQDVVDTFSSILEEEEEEEMPTISGYHIVSISSK